MIYEDVVLDIGYRLDLLIENKVVIEIKAVELMNNLHMAQMLTYLKLTDCKLGLLINFNTPLFTKGFKRVINDELEE